MVLAPRQDRRLRHRHDWSTRHRPQQHLPRRSLRLCPLPLYPGSASQPAPLPRLFQVRHHQVDLRRHRRHQVAVDLRRHRRHQVAVDRRRRRRQVVVDRYVCPPPVLLSMRH